MQIRRVISGLSPRKIFMTGIITTEDNSFTEGKEYE